MTVVAITTVRCAFVPTGQSETVDAGTKALGLFLVTASAIRWQGRHAVVRVFSRQIAVAAKAGVGFMN